MENVRLTNNDCLNEMAKMSDNVIDTIITDPPYCLEFNKDKRDFNDVWASGNIIKNAPAFRRVPVSDKIKFKDFTKEWAKEALRITKCGGTLLCFGHPKVSHYLTCGLEEAGWELKEVLMWIYSSGYPKSFDVDRSKINIDYNGFKTHALKPAYEPIIMAIKPNDGTYIQNAEKYNVAGLNIEECKADNGGKFPSNLIIDEDIVGFVEEKDRFFFVSKPSKKEKRDYNNHPTVKPIMLMEYLCKLTKTPYSGIVLDPFMGSGTTAIACINTNRNFIGIELNGNYFAIAKRRVEEKRKEKETKAPSLFDELN